jgi:uncharacterized protein YjbI with pentapeptide repeats
MDEDMEKPQSNAGEIKAPKIKANENPWYLLATLYGEAEEADQELNAKNRVAWNRYFAANLDEKTRAWLGWRHHRFLQSPHAPLIEKKTPRAEELMPFSAEELRQVEQAFAQRKGSAENITLPKSGASVDFSNVQFDRDALFDGFIFFGTANFMGAAFSGRASYDAATFLGEANFKGATFSGSTLFWDATFLGEANFNDATFSGATLSSTFFDRAAFLHEAKFSNTTFSRQRGVSFRSASFSKSVHFHSATFNRAAVNFDWAIFSELANFVETTFIGPTTFKNATFSDQNVHRGAHFRGTTFSQGAIFQSATFSGVSSFENAKMEGKTSFEGAKFETKPPEFFGAKLHEGTIWRGIKKWPTPKTAGEAGKFVDAYERLKLEMDRLKKHEDELVFFALELQSRRVLDGPRRGLPIALYGLISDYGRSYTRPLYALCAVVAFGSLPFLLSHPIAPWQSVGLSIANTLNVFGFRKDFFDSNNAIANLPTMLKILAAFQTILGTILLFLFGLGIRNRFRMK